MAQAVQAERRGDRGEEEITYVRLRDAVRVNRSTETYLDAEKQRLLITWHAKGLLVEPNSGSKVIIPAGNVLWVEVK